MATARTTTTTSVDEEFIDIVDKNKLGMAAELDRREETRSLRDRFWAAPKALRRYMDRVVHWAHAESVVGGAKSIWTRARGMLSKVTGPLRRIGFVNLLGAALTCQRGRDLVRAGVGHVANAVMFVPKMAGRFLGWVGRKIGLGSTVDSIEKRYKDIEFWVQDKFSQAMDWLDDHEHHGAMRWGRSVYQSTVISRTINLAPIPDQLRTPAHIASLLIPNVGVGKKIDKDKTTSESKWSVVKDTFDSGEPRNTSMSDAKADPTPKPKPSPVKAVPSPAPAKATVPATPVVPPEVVEAIEGVIAGSGKKVTINRVTTTNGVVSYEYEGKTYAETDLPGNITLVSTETAVATTTPPPPLNRAARRAEERAKS